MMMQSSDPTARAVSFRRTGSAEMLYEAEVDGHRWEVRMNDFPAEPLYTLLIDGEAALHIDDWPSAWKRPPRE